MAALKIIVMSLFLISCGAQLDYALERASQVNKSGQFVEFSTYDSNGDQVSMNKSVSKTTLIIFSSLYCYSCIMETEKFIASLDDPTIPPNKIDIITLMVGGTILDADDFKFFNAVPWTVAIDEDMSLVRKYCGVSTTPCLVVQDPVRGIIKTHVGEMPLEELKSYTGEWE